MLLAHHYVRYLGDLSGGQLIGRALRRIYDLPDKRGTEGYQFDSIVEREGVQGSLPRAARRPAVGPRRRTRLVAEARVAYRLNTNLFTELMATIPLVG